MKLTGINIPTSNAKRLADFYQKVLGANIDESHGGPQRIEIWFGDNKNSTVFLVASQDVKYKRPETTACQGFEFYVSDVEAEYNRIQELGIEIKEPPKELPWGCRYFHMVDPDGNGIDIVQAL